MPILPEQREQRDNEQGLGNIFAVRMKSPSECPPRTRNLDSA